MAAKAPYPGHAPFENMNGHGATGRRDLSSGAAPRRTARFIHLKDLQAKANAETKDLGAQTPIRTLLNRAQQAATQANSLVDFKQIDRAYVQYIASSEILIEIIPRHRDFPSVSNSSREWYGLYHSTRKQVDSQNAMFHEIRDMIIEDNERSGIKPTYTAISTRSSVPGAEARPDPVPTGGSRPLSMPDRSTTRHDDPHELFIDQGQSQARPDINVRHSMVEEAQGHHADRKKSEPFNHPTSNGLDARIDTSGIEKPTAAIDLEQRFSQLRIKRKQVQTLQMADHCHDYSHQYVEMPSFTQHQHSADGCASLDKHPRPDTTTAPSSSRPSRPRDMPAAAATPPHPPKVPLHPGQASTFPRAPSPAYDPSKSASLSAQAIPQPNGHRFLHPGHTIIEAVPESPGRVSNISNAGWVYGVNDTSHSTQRSRLAITPSARTITTKELKDHLRSSNVLIIDVRSRQQYDQGHIFAQNVMCVEPVILRSGMSAEDLEDRLVVSPQTEQSLFEQRNTFDLVVYYDQETISDKFLDGSPTSHNAFALRALHDCLYEFNFDKPLLSRPVLLLGGLEAWMDLMTAQSLAVTKTAIQVQSARSQNGNGRLGRPIGRVRMASANSSLEVRRRRLREYNPLNADEEKTWLEQARVEGVHASDALQAESDSDSESSSEQSHQSPSPFVHSYDEYLRKFPEQRGGQQSMTAIPQTRLHPPSRAAPAMPIIPSRPPPAVPRPSYGGVTERESSQSSPTSRQLPSTQPPLYTGRAASHRRKLPRTGLVNFSVTCYMNATIQCLNATLPLSQFFLDDRWRTETQRNWKGSHGIMPEIYANLIRDLWRGDKKAVRPNSFRKFCARLNAEWGVDRQQDAKEFFDFLVDCLHEDLNRHWNYTQLQPLTAVQEARRERLPPQEVSSIEWDRYSHREKSYVSDQFAGQHASKLRCTTCYNTSTTHEAFYSISVEIPRTGKADIYDCLQSYCKEEKLGRDELWKCPHCKCEREATKQITITRAPTILVVHFKRFSASKNETARKVHTPISFPLHQLDIKPYMLPSPERNIKEAIAQAGNGEPAITPPYLYDCYAVMRHLGSTLSGGHYIALVNDNARGCWRKFDDEYSSDFDPTKLRPEQRLQNEQAYLVFYIRAPAR